MRHYLYARRTLITIAVAIVTFMIVSCTVTGPLGGHLTYTPPDGLGIGPKPPAPVQGSPGVR